LRVVVFGLQSFALFNHVKALGLSHNQEVVGTGYIDAARRSVAVFLWEAFADNPTPCLNLKLRGCDLLRCRIFWQRIEERYQLISPPLSLHGASAIVPVSKV